MADTGIRGRERAVRLALVAGAALLWWAPVAVAQNASTGSTAPAAERPQAARGAVPAESDRSAEVLTLSEAVSLALERNRDLADARLELDNANEQVREAWGEVMPRVDVSAGYTRNLTVPTNFLPAIIFDPDAEPGELIPVQFGAENTWNMEMRLEQPIFQAGAIVGVGAAADYRELQEEMTRGTAQAVATQVRLAYHEVLLAEEAVRLREQSVERIRSTLEETRALRGAGMASDYDVLQLEVQLANIEPQLRQARNEAEAAQRALAVELGLDPADTLEVAGSLLDVDPEPISAAGRAGVLRAAGSGAPASQPVDRLVQQAIGERSDLEQLELTQELRGAEVRAAQAEFLPTVSLFGTYSINAQQNGDPDFFGPSAAYRSYGRLVGVQVSVPLFTGFQRMARVGQRKAALRRSEVQHDLARDRARNEVRTLVDRAAEARDRAQAQQMAVGQASRGFEIARSRFAEGVGSRLEVTEAELALRESEFNYAQAIYDYLGARARLDRAVGTVPLVDTDDENAYELGISQ